MDTEKMRLCLDALPPPGGEVVLECIVEIERLRAELLESKKQASELEGEANRWNTRCSLAQFRGNKHKDRIDGAVVVIKKYIRDADTGIASEKLGGNIVKEQFWRGQLTGLLIALDQLTYGLDEG